MDFIEIRNIGQKWFDETTPQNFKQPSATLGSDANGTIIIKHIVNDIDADDYLLAVVIPAEAGDLSVALANKKITVTLAFNGTAVDDTKNTAALIAEAINEIDGMVATASGTGATAISEATAEDIAFTNGQWGTPCSQSGVCLVSSGTYYVSTKADNSKFNNGWRTFTLTDF